MSPQRQEEETEKSWKSRPSPGDQTTALIQHHIMNGTYKTSPDIHNNNIMKKNLFMCQAHRNVLYEI